MVIHRTEVQQTVGQGDLAHRAEGTVAEGHHHGTVGMKLQALDTVLRYS